MRKPKPKELISMPFLVDRYLSDTEDLSFDLHGVYCLLLFHMWKNKGSLPDNDDAIALKLRTSPAKWRAYKAKLSRFLVFYGPDDSRLITQKRLQEQWNYALSNAERAKAKASKSATVRWERERTISALLSAPSNASSTPPSNASVMPYLREDITTSLPLTARDDEEVFAQSNHPAALAVRGATKTATWRGPHPKPPAKRNGAA